MSKIVSVIITASILMTAQLAWACQQPVCTALTVCDEPGSHLGGQRCHQENSCTAGTCGSVDEAFTGGAVEKAEAPSESSGISIDSLIEKITPTAQDQKCWVQIGECDDGLEKHGCWVSAGHYGAPACNCCTPSDENHVPSQQ